jgi:regulator of nucleoside diphosphate kinase
MRKRSIHMTKFDLERLGELLSVASDFSYRDRADLRELEAEMARAKAVDPKKVPADVVTMNSRVRMTDLDSQKELVYTLVFPKDADFDQGRISVVSPVGTAILGYRVGDTIEWNVPAGKKRLRIEELLYQPEAAGDFHL